MRGTNVVIAAFMTAGLLAAPAVAVDAYPEPAPTKSSSSTSVSAEAKLLASARKAISQNNLSKARADLLKAEKLNSRNADTKNLLGYVNRKMNKTKPAMRYYRAALRIDPNHRGANEYLGELYLMLNQPAKAQAQLQKLEQICGTNCRDS
jgi:tetratricopeptide (TPR) repeat protein